MRIERISPRDLLRIAQMALAAGAAWELALQLPNHGRPFFAPIAAVIALGAERGRRGRQAMTMMVGVAVGILVGAGVVAVVGTGWWQLVVAVAAALVVTSAAGGGPLLRNQAAASAVLIVALHTPGQNLALQRLVDALIGGGIAIVLAQLLFPIDPVRHVLDEARLLRRRVAATLDRAGRALTLAREVVRRAPRRRPPPEAADLAHALADMVRTLDPDESREWAARVEEAVAGLRAADDSLGASVMAAGGQELAGHALRAAEARAASAVG